MLEVKFDVSDFDDLAKQVDGAARQLPFLIAYSLTNSVRDARVVEREIMVSVFDRPTPWTLNSLQVKPATKTDLSATLDFKSGAPKYLSPEVWGGGRALKRSEIAFGNRYIVPTKFAPLDQYGNVSKGFLRQMMSQLGTAELMAGYTANMSKRSRPGAIKRAGGQFFIKGAVIYQRSGRKATPMFVFVRQQPQYKARYPFFEAGKRIIQDRFDFHFVEAWRKYVIDDIKPRRSR